MLGWLAPTLVFFRGLFLGFTLFWHDVTITVMPMREWAARCLRQGDLPTWCPFVGGGSPILAQAQGGVFYPTNLLSYVLGLPTWWDYTFQCWLHLGLAGTLFFLWLRLGHRLSPLAAFMAAQTYALSGYMVGHIMHLPMLQAAAWLPAALWLAERLARADRPALRDSLVLALVTALAGLAGHPQTALHVVATALVWGLIRAGRARALPFGARAAGTVALGLALAAVQLVPTALQARISEQRRTDPQGFLRELSLTPRSLANLLHPEIYGSYADGDYFGGDHHYEVCGWMGGLPLLLALPGLLFPPVRHRRLRTAAGIVLALGLFFGLAQLNPVYDLIALVPSLGVFRGAGRLVLLVITGTAVLAALGLDALRDGPRPRLTLIAAGGLCLALGVAAPSALRAAKPALASCLLPDATAREGGDRAAGAAKVNEKLDFWARRLSPSDPYVALWLAVATALLAAALRKHRGQAAGARVSLAVAVGLGLLHLLLLAYWYHPWHRPAGDLGRGQETASAVRSWGWEGTGYFYTDPSVPAVTTRPRWRPYSQDAVRQWVLDYLHSLRPTTNVLASVACLGDPYPLAPDRLWDLTERGIPQTLAGRGFIARPDQVLRALGVVWVITTEEGARRLGGVETRPLPGGRGEVIARLAGPGARLAWLPAGVTLVDGRAEALRELSAPHYSWRRAVIEAPPDAAPLATTPGPPAGRVDDCSPVPAGRFSLRVTASRDTWVMLAVVFHPGWHVTVDGEQARLYRANAAMSAVPVGPGSHEIELRFVCPGLALGAGVSLAALLALAALAALTRRPPRRQARVGL